MLNQEDALRVTDEKLRTITLPEGWGAKAIIEPCLGCGNPVLFVEFENLDGRKATIKIAHSSKEDQLFHDLETKWELFVAKTLPSVMQRLPLIRAGHAGTFATGGIVYIPGFGFGLALSLTDLTGLFTGLEDTDN